MGYTTCILRVVSSATILVLLFLPVAHAGHPTHEGAGQEKPESIKYGHLKTFGPGEAPHIHALDLTTFARVPSIARAADDLPPPIARDHPAAVRISLHVKEVISEIAPGIEFHYWTFDGKIPGPFLRVAEGDSVELTINNDPSSSHTHSIDLHAVNGPGGGSVVTQTLPGESKSFRFKALKPGLYVYHCASSNVPLHMTNGLYGLILVEPKGGLPGVDREYYVMQGEIYTEGKIGDTGFQNFDAEKMLGGAPEYVVFNGRVNALVDHPLTARVGERVRLFVGNAGVSLVSSFHVIGELFDTVHPEASLSTVNRNVQTTVIPAGGATIVEFEVDVPGDYILVDHALSRIDKGAWGVLNVTGPDKPDIFSAIK